MRIGFFTDTFAPTHDGVARETDALAGALSEAGHPVEVVTVRLPGTAVEELRPDGVRVRRVPSFPAPGYAQYRIAVVPPSLVLDRRRTRRFDVVHVHTPGLVGLAGLGAARRAGVPVLATYHTNLSEILRGARAGPVARRFFRGWARFAVELCRSSDVATAPTEGAAKALGGDGARSGAPVVVPNGVEVERFRPGADGPAWKERLASEGRPLVTYVGRLTLDKGILTLLEALDRLPPEPPFLAVIGGEGPQAAAVEARIAASPRLRARVRFLGPVAEAEKPALLAQSRLFVLPSTADTSSVAVLEAMAAGATVLVSREGGPGEIVQDGVTGVTVDPRDPSAIAAALAALLGDTARANRLAAEAARWVRAHGSITETARRYLALYARLVGASPAEPAGAG